MTYGWLSKSQEYAQIFEEELSRLEEKKRQKTLGLIPSVATTPAPEAPWMPQEQPTYEVPMELPELPVPTAPMPWMKTPTPTEQPPPPTEITPKGKEFQWWEKPAEITEYGFTKAGEVIANLPIVPTLLRQPIVQKVFEGIDWLDKSFAAITAGNFAPEVNWQSGENWLEHQKRRYEQWEAPTYVKGLAEAANPVFWLPWVGWAGRGAKLMVLGGKTVKALDAMTDTAMLATKSGKGFIAPTIKQFTESISGDNYRRFALWAENKPVISSIIKTVAGDAAFIRQVPQNLAQEARNAVIYRGVLNERFANIANVKVRRVYQAMGGVAPEDLFQIKEGLMGGVTPIAELKSLAWNDVLAYPGKYKWDSPVAEATALEIGKYTKLLKDIAEVNGVKIPVQKTLFPDYFQYVNRVVEGKLDPATGKLIKYPFTDPFAQLVYETALDGMKAGVKYSDDVMGNLNLLSNTISRKIADKQFDDVVKKMGKLASTRWMEAEPALAEQYANARDRIASMLKVSRSMKNAIPGEGNLIGKPVRQNYLDMLREVGENNLADRIAQTQTVKSSDLIGYIKTMSKSAQMISAKEAKPIVEALTALPERASLDDALKVVSNFISDEQKAMRVAERIYQQSAKGMIKENKKLLVGLREEVDTVLKREMNAYKPIRSDVSVAKQTWGKADIFRNEAKFKVHPAFGKYIFPKEVVDVIEPMLVDKGNKWLKSMATISGVSQASVASLDISAPFIQGLALFGTNPVAWAYATGKMMWITVQPKRIYTELVNREASILERVANGGTSVAIDIFEGLPALEKIGRKIGGEVGEKAIKETFGRGATAYLAFGEIAKDELYKAGKVMIAGRGLTAEVAQKQMQELARSADRMTGMMSSKALGVPLSQRQLERAWVFFAPQYTRAGLSFAADVLKGGFTGAEARKALVGMALGGLTFYKASCDALGQPMNLDPKSAKFMTVKIGESHVGVGGIYYGITRLLADIAATSKEDWTELSPLNLSRVDNPFYKFMYNRSSQLAGFTMGMAIEHKNFLGEPFENVGDYAKFLAEKITPISMQSFIPSKDRPTDVGAMGIAAGTQILGAREFPKSTWETRDAMRDNLATQTYNKPWADLTRAEQRVIESQSLGLISLQEQISKTQVQRGKPKDILFDSWRDEIDWAQNGTDNTESRDARIRRASANAQKTGDYYTFRKQVEDIENDYSAILKQIETNPKYTAIQDMLNEPKTQGQLSKMQEMDIASYNWQKNRYSKDMIDENGDPAWDRIEKFRQEFATKFGMEALDYVENVLPISGRDLPPLYLELRKARQAMKPYWAVLTVTQKIYGEPTTVYQQRRQDRIVGSLRKRMRLQDKQLNDYYNLFYRRVV